MANTDVSALSYCEVYRHLTIDYTVEKYLLNDLLGCIKEMHISPFYGNYVLTDNEGKILGKSDNNGSISFFENNMPEESRFWHTIAREKSIQYQVLQELKIRDTGQRPLEQSDIGMCFSTIPEVYISFEKNKELIHKDLHKVNVYYTEQNVWNTNTANVVFLR